MSQHDPGAAGSRRARRRHAPARRARGPVWLLAAGGVAVLGAAAALLSGGSGTKGGTGSPEGGSGGPPALIQADPTDAAETTRTPEPSGPGGSGSGVTAAVTVPAPGRTGPTATDKGPKETATAAPSGSATAGPGASPTAEAPVTTDHPGKPGRGRGATKRPK
ncbi:hypothetical protein [Streptomyces gardneri]|uniref:hypothetical protein n=1 Tax=Streptomyces gardneri TaxID=66892 RepID=UPI0035DE5E6B